MNQLLLPIPEVYLTRIDTERVVARVVPMSRVDPFPAAVELTMDEISIAHHIAGLRRIDCIENHRANGGGYGGFSGMAWQNDCLGTLGEMALAKQQGVYWSGNLNSFKAPDVGKFQVRAAEQERYQLIIRPDDPVDDVYVLVTGRAPKLWVIGWMTGREARQVGKWGSPNSQPEAWWVAQSYLHKKALP
jgi:hypothetical protein